MESCSEVKRKRPDIFSFVCWIISVIMLISIAYFKLETLEFLTGGGNPPTGGSYGNIYVAYPEDTIATYFEQNDSGWAFTFYNKRYDIIETRQVDDIHIDEEDSFEDSCVYDGVGLTIRKINSNGKTINGAVFRRSGWDGTPRDISRVQNHLALESN